MPKLRTDSPARTKAIQTYKDYTPDWLEKILNFVVGDPEDPASQVTQLAMPVPMVSAYAKFFGAEGAKAARLKGTQNAIETLKQVGQSIGASPEQIAEAVKVMEKRPRVAAHTAVQEIFAKDPSMGASGIANYTPSGHGMGTIGLTERAAPSMAHSTAHEMGHAAQNIGVKNNFTPMYNDAELLTGYFDNPFERSARRIADNKVPLPSTPETAAVWDQLLEQMGKVRRPGLPPVTEQLRKMGIIK